MDAERLRAFLLKLPHVTETVQWGGSLVFWVGDKAIGGKIFAVCNLSGQGRVISYMAGPERFAELVEREEIVPAPYMARNFWVAVEHWGVFRPSEWEEELRAGHGIVYDKLPPKTKNVLAMPAGERRRLIVDRRRELAEKAAGPFKVKTKSRSPSGMTNKKTKAKTKRKQRIKAAKVSDPDHREGRAKPVYVSRVAAAESGSPQTGLRCG